MPIPADIAQRIRERGPLLDMPLTQAIYRPLHEHQPRDGVNVTRDLRYGEAQRHNLDVYRPQANAQVALPVIVFFHGGGYIRGDKSDKENIGYYFARQGYTVFVPNYRLAPADRWPAGAQDVGAAYAWISANAAKFGGDAQRLFLIGESAGASHVAAATLVKRFHPPQGFNIKAAIFISGVYDVHLEKLARPQFGIATPDPRNEAYFGAEFDRYPSMSTVALIDAAPFPVLITYAELDMLQMQVQAGELFAKLITQHGFAPQIRMIRDHNHLTQVYSVNTGDASLSQPLLDFMQCLDGSATQAGHQPIKRTL